MSLYSPLRTFLRNHGDQRVSMTFSDVERVLGRRLPPSASGASMRQWWANTDTHSQAKAWLEAGRTAKLDVDNKAVTFVREATAEAEAAVDLIVVPRKHLEAAAFRLLEDVAEERSISIGEAMAILINSAGAQRRRAAFDWFDHNVAASTARSADLIRAERDER